MLSVVPTGTDLLLVCVGAVATLWATVLLRGLVALAVPRRCRPRKLAASVTEALEYAASSAAGHAIVWRQPWAWPAQPGGSAAWWRGYDALDRGRPAHQWMDPWFAAFYLWYAARYCAALVRVVWLEPRRRDHRLMVAHHILTVAVVLISYWGGLNRVGAVVMVLFDPADVPLHLAKVCRYLGWQGPADLLFALFAVSFLVSRIGLFSYVCWSAHVESARYLRPGWDVVAGWSILYAILAINVAWGWMVVRVVLRVASGAGAADDRSDSDE